MRIRRLQSGLGLPSRPRRSSRKNATSVPLRSDRLHLNRGLAPAQERASQQWSRDSVPGQNHPVHNSALRAELGHNMYSTGMFAIGLEKLNCANGTLKMYSHGPIEASTYTASHRRTFYDLFQANTHFLSGTAWSACYYLYRIASEALLSQEHSRDVHSQIFSVPCQSSGPLLTRSGKSLPASAREWNLFCRLGKSSDGRSVLSRPWLSLQARPGRMLNLCRFKIDGQVPVELYTSLTITGNLKSNQYRGSDSGLPPEYAPGSALQAIADNLAIQVKYALAEQQEFESHGAVMANIRQRLLSHLPSSPIASALDLVHLGITLQYGSAKRRLVQNILLNHDGSVKTDAEMPVSLPIREPHSAIETSSGSSSKELDLKTQLASQANHREAAQSDQETGNSAKGTEPLVFNFSDSTRSKLGMDITWRINGDPQYRFSMDDQRLALEELDRQCQTLDSRGFDVLANALARMRRASPSTAEFYIFGAPKDFSSGASVRHDMEPAATAYSKHRQMMYDWHTGSDILRVSHYNLSFKLGLRLPGILGIQVKLGDDTRELHFMINLDSRVSNGSELPLTCNSSSTISDELSFLTKAAHMVIDRVCQATAFESLQACTETIAEAIFRFLKFRSSSLPITKVRVRAIVEDGSQQSTATRPTASSRSSAAASRSKDSAELHVKDRTEGSSTLPFATGKPITSEHASPPESHKGGNEADYVKPHQVNDADSGVAIASSAISIEESHRDTDLDDSHTEHESNIDQNTPYDPIPAGLGSSSEGSASNDGKPTAELTRGPRLDVIVEAGITRPYFDSGVASSFQVTQHTGMKFYRCQALYSPKHASALANISPATVDRTVERAILQSHAGGLQTLLSTAANVMAAMPYKPWSTRLNFRQMPSDAMVHGLQLCHSRRMFDMSVAIQGDPDIESSQKPAPSKPETLKLVLPGLEFRTGEGNVFSVKVSLHALPASTTSSDVQVQVQDLCEILRAIIAPILLGWTPSSLEGLAQECSESILRSEQPLAGLLHAREVDVRLSQWRCGKLIRVNRAVATHPGVDVHPTLRKYIALGSNIGDRIEAIESACRSLDGEADIRVSETSPLYETDPMYVEDQDRFLNGVCEIVTSLSPIKLLDRLQAVENELGRHKTIDKGPRNIDLDILAHGQNIVTTERLTVPHALMLEREFVLRPLSDTSGVDWRHPSTRLKAGLHQRLLPRSSAPMYPLTALGAGLEPLRSLDPKRKTKVMSILNVTPDSFSDGGVNQPSDSDSLRATLLANIAAGATIIDIGGQSSRPNAEDVTPEEEISRILPAIELIKSLPEAQGIAISIDTYRASVAEAAINAGAHMINDISAGLLDPEMLPTVGRLGCTYIMMHMRGTPATMQNDENTSYPDGLIPTIAYELRQRLDAVQKAGIRRWRIILDPGIGFAKTVEQNIELLQRFGELRNWKGLETYPWLVGTSRKGFIGKITGVTDAKDRVSGTAATVTAAVQGGAEIVRVHDVKEMVEVVKMADAMYRS